MSKIYMSYDGIGGDVELHDTLEEAKEAAEANLDFYKEQAGDYGWEDGISESIGYGVVKGLCRETKRYNREEYTKEEWDELDLSGDFEVLVDYEVEDV